MEQYSSGPQSASRRGGEQRDVASAAPTTALTAAPTARWW